MTSRDVAIALAAAGVFVAILFSLKPLHAEEDPRKEYLRLQATEFCSVVRPPPPGYIEFLTKQVEGNPKGPFVKVLEREAVLGQRYMELHCGDT